jgi:hypothetical protein
VLIINLANVYVINAGALRGRTTTRNCDQFTEYDVAVVASSR